jgi:hypothetical protein
MQVLCPCFQNNLQRYYNIVYDQAVSPSGNHLAVCDSYGQISTFRCGCGLLGGFISVYVDMFL